MSYQQRLNAIYKISEQLNSITEDNFILNQAYIKNNWFTPQWQLYAFKSWASNLTLENLNSWLSKYQIPDNPNPKTIGIIMAGNIPMVGFHDLICVLITGNKALIKVSADDEVLIAHLVNLIIGIEPTFVDKIVISKGRFEIPFDAVIATGSNNTNRYFEYYFKNVPNILRKNRNSIAVLSGFEAPEDYLKLADDIFIYFGLGCRNVSKLLLPQGFDFEPLFNGFNKYQDVVNHNKYINNYTYHKSIFLMNQTKHLDNGFILLKEDENLASPLSVVYYSFYENLQEVENYITQNTEQIQCVVSKQKILNSIPFGSSQTPALNYYADNVDTIKFLLEI